MKKFILRKIKLFKNLKFKSHDSNFNILLVLLSGFAFRLFLANFGTLQLDYGTFVSWSTELANEGFKTFYSGWSDYLPGYLYVLYALGKVNLIPYMQVILMKLPAILADIFTGLLIYKIVDGLKGKKLALILSIFYVFNPAVFANSSLWGQVDSLTSLFALFALYLASKNKKLPSAIILSLGTLIKPQAAFIAPAILYLVLKNKWKLKEIVSYALTGLAVFVLGFVPFNPGKNIFTFISERLLISSSQYPYGSVNAFSFWGLLGFWKPDNITVWIGLGLAIALMAVLLFLLRKKQNLEYLLAALSLLITFFFLTRMHERHLLPVLAPLLVASALNPFLLLIYLGLSFTYLANLAYAYYWITEEFKEIFNPVIIKFFIVTNFGLLIAFIISTFKKINFNLLKFKLNLKQNLPLPTFATKDISDKLLKILLGILIIFTLFTRTYSLNKPEEKYFDEVYHAFTAGLVLSGDPKAWEWWNPHPEGFAYEWTHPPIAKLGMVVGMFVFGENAFGWRIVQAILGTLSVLLVYLIANFIFKDKLVGLLSAFVFSLDGLVLVLNRIGMNDSYVLFFALLSVYLFLKDKNFLSSFFFGLALASKWSAIYTLPILFVSHFVFRKKIKLSLLSFLVVPLMVYVGSYSVMFLTGHTWDQFVEVQRQMWWYHTNLKADHPYTSPAWSWPLLLRPIYLYDGSEMNNTAARIYAFGNPAVFWFGLFSVIVSFFVSAKEKIKRLGFVVFSYLVFFLPWLASPRIMFLYHYLPSIPFLAIASGYILRRFPKTKYTFFAVAFMLFIYFYPHWTGLRIPLWMDSSYYWFPSWR